MVSPLNFVISPLKLVVQSVLREGLRVVLHFSDHEMEDPGDERHAVVRGLKAKQWSQVMSSGLFTRELTTWRGEIFLGSSW